MSRKYSFSVIGVPRKFKELSSVPRCKKRLGTTGLDHADKDVSNKTTNVALTSTKQQRKLVNLQYPSRTKKVFLVKLLISDKGFIRDGND